MKTTCPIVLLLSMMMFVTSEAAAHRLVPDDGSHTSPDKALVLEDMELSQVVYHEVTPASNQLWVALDAEVGQNLYWQLGLPIIEGLEDYRPTVAVLGPGLPTLEAPFEIPEGLGGVLVETVGMPVEHFDEHFTGTVDWIITEQDRTVAEAGRYYVVAYHPEGAPGKFWVAIGRREAFGLADILGYADVLAFVRVYHEVGDEPLPVLPRLLLTLSRVVRMLRSLLAFL